MPNPFTTRTTIEFALPNEGAISAGAHRTN